MLQKITTEIIPSPAHAPQAQCGYKLAKGASPTGTQEPLMQSCVLK